MKNFRKIVALFLAMILAIGNLSITAFASETGSENTIPENAERHTIEVTLEPGENLDGTNESGIAPYMWGQESHNVSTGYITYTERFYVPERYFAFEMSATDTSGNAVSRNYTVQLLLQQGLSTIASITGTANGTVYKTDWIDLSANQYYLFAIHNSSGTALTITLTYYSWT